MMESVLEFLSNNWEVVVAVVIFVLAVILRGRQLAWFQWFNEVSFLAWDQAEKKGLLDGWRGAEKLRIYLEIWRREYEKKWGDPPTEGTIEQAKVKAAELSQLEKTIRLDPR